MMIFEDREFDKTNIYIRGKRKKMIKDINKNYKYVYEKDGKVIKEFYTLQECSDYFKKPISTLHRIIEGHNKYKKELIIKKIKVKI